MTDQDSSLNIGKKEDYEFYAEKLIAFADSRIGRCNAVAKALATLREHPDSLAIYSADEIMEINAVERQIPIIIEVIQGLKWAIRVENWQSVVDGTIYDQLDNMGETIEQIEAFAEEKKQMIPKVKLTASHWILMPYNAIALLVHSAINKVVVWRLKKEKKRLEEENLRLIERKKEIARKIEELARERELIKKK